MNAWQSHTAAGILYVGTASVVMAVFLLVGTCGGWHGTESGGEGGREDGGCRNEALVGYVAPGNKLAVGIGARSASI